MSATPTQRLTYREIFWMFFKSGLAFGGGISIAGVLRDELVDRRKLMRGEEFLSLYGIARIIPSGTMTALAVAYGYRFGGWLGTLVALVALALPAFVLTVILAAGYSTLQASSLFAYVPFTLLPAALAFIVAAAIRLGRDILRPSRELVIALGAFVGAAIFSFNPSVMLLLGGVAGVLAFAWPKGASK